MSLIDHFSASSHRAHRVRPLGLLSLLSLLRSRRTLADLDARALEDIGVTKKAADLEANRSFWDVPHTWRNQ